MVWKSGNWRKETPALLRLAGALIVNNLAIAGMQFTDAVMLFGGVAQREFVVDPVVVASPDPDRLEVARRDQVGEDPLGGSLGDADSFCDVADPQVGLGGDGEQHMCVVGQERPATRFVGVLHRSPPDQ